MDLVCDVGLCFVEDVLGFVCFVLVGVVVECVLGWDCLW